MKRITRFSFITNGLEIKATLYIGLIQFSQENQFLDWLKYYQSDGVYAFSSGKLYFSKSEDAVMFALTWGIEWYQQY